MTIFTVDADNKTTEQIGTQLGIDLKKKFPEFEANYDTYLDFLLSDTLFKQLNRQAQLLKITLEPENKAEIEAVAQQLNLEDKDKLGDGQLSRNEFWLLQFLSDLTAVNKGTAIAGFDKSAPSPIIARNVDWKNNKILRQLQAITVYKFADNTLVNIGFAGILGVVNGFNQQGLFVSSIDSSSTLQSTKVLTNQKSTAFSLKDVLKQTFDVDNASQFLREQHYPRHQQLLLADKKKSVVLEQAQDNKGRLRTASSALINTLPALSSDANEFIMVSCFVLKVSPKNCHSSGDYYRWNRLKNLLESSKSKPSINALSTIMQDQKNQRQAIYNNNTLQTVIFTPLGEKLYFYSRSALPSESSKRIFQKLHLVNHSKSFIAQFKILIFAIGSGILIIAWVYSHRQPKKKK